MNYFSTMVTKTNYVVEEIVKELLDGVDEVAGESGGWSKVS